MSKTKKYTINIWLKNNGVPFTYMNCTAYEKGSFYCIYDGNVVHKYPISDIWRTTESYPKKLKEHNE